MSAALRVLLVEPDPERAARLRAAGRAAPGLRCRSAAALPAGAPDADCIVVDAAAAPTAVAVAEGVPVVALTSGADDRAALAALRAGAAECAARESLDGPALARAALLAVERQRLRRELLALALRDPLTGLANRAVLDDRLAHALASARRHGGSLALLFVDLDAFKPVNDRLGHQAGDAVLVAVAERLRRAVRPSDTVARHGGDEFAVLCEKAGSREDVLAIARRLVADLAQPFTVGGATVRISASVGVAFAQPGAEDPGELVRRADRAMYAAKRDRGGVAVATPDLVVA